MGRSTGARPTPPTTPSCLRLQPPRPTDQHPWESNEGATDQGGACKVWPERENPVPGVREGAELFRDIRWRLPGAWDTWRQVCLCRRS